MPRLLRREEGRGKLEEWQRCLLAGNEKLLGSLARWPVGLAGFGLLHLFFFDADGREAAGWRRQLWGRGKQTAKFYLIFV